MSSETPVSGLTVSAALRRACATLEATAAAESAPRLEAELLLGQLLDKPRAWLFSHGDEPLQTADQDRFDALIRRRRDGEPIAYLLRTRSFWTLDLEVGPEVLIPRPETELLVELALERIPQQHDSSISLLELGTGSGAIALALLSERPALKVTASDISREALAIARRNGERLAPGKVQWLESDWYAAVQGRFDMIISNPPYVAADDEHLHRGDCRFEPQLALTPGPDSLAAYRTIIDGAREHLAPGAYLLLEHGYDQGEALRTMLADKGFSEVSSHRDLQTHERVTLGRLRPRQR